MTLTRLHPLGARPPSSVPRPSGVAVASHSRDPHRLIDGYVMATVAIRNEGARLELPCC
jgi:hypothetical protein